MSRYYLSDRDRRWLEQRGDWSFVSEDRKDGWFRLFNKNGGRTTFVRPVSQVDNAMIWVVEAEEPIDPYFVNVLTPVGATK